MNGQPPTGGCSCCGMSRRCFLATASTAAVAAPLVSIAARSEMGDLGETIDVGTFRPKPRVDIVGVVVRQKPPYWLGWPGTSYDLEGQRKEFETAFTAYADELGVNLRLQEEPLESEEAVNAYVNKLKAEKPDAVLIHLQHLSYWRWVDALTKAGVPAIVFSPIGTSFTQHTLEISRRPGVHVISSLEASAMKQAFRMIRAKKQLEETRLLVVHGEKREEVTMDHLGTKVRHVPRRMLHELFEQMPETEEVHDVARMMRRRARKTIEPNKQDTINAARSYVTAKRLMRDEASNAITTDCLGMVTTRVVPTPPCMAASMCLDAGVTYGCEADLYAAMSLLLVGYLFDKPGFMQDPVAETVKNYLIGAHCTSPSRLNGFDEKPEPFILRSHSESAIGVSMQVLWKEEQPITMVRFRNPTELILDTGTVVANVDTPPAGGCRTSMEVAMDRMEDARDVMGFHQVFFYGNHRRDVESFCQVNGIKVINSPAQAPRVGG